MAKKTKAIDLVKERLELLKSNPSFVMEQKGWSKAEYENEVDLLEQQIVKSKRGKSSRNKGSNYERVIAKIFKDKLGVELTRTPQSGGFAKKSQKAEEFRGDIVSLDADIDFMLHIECKDHSSWSLPSWIRQAEDDCPEGKIPVVVMHRRQKLSDEVVVKSGKEVRPVVQKTGQFITLPLELFLDIVDKDKIVKEKTTKPKKKVPKKGSVKD